MSYLQATEKASYVIVNEFTKVVRQVFEYQSGAPVDIEPTLVSLLNVELSEETALLSSLITIEGEDYHCSLVLVGTTPVITSLAQVEVDDPRDWIGELANLIAGGMTNNFYKYDTENHLGLPTNVCHAEWVTNDFDWEILEVRTRFGTVFASLNCSLGPDTEWVLDASRTTADAGPVFMLCSDFPKRVRSSDPERPNRVLVIDDSSTIRKLVARPLKRAGFEVLEAADGQEGVEKIRTGNVDCVVCDLHLPYLSGLDLVRTVKSDSEFDDLPIVMLSTEGKQSVLHEAKEAGAVAWVVKPCNLDLLVSTVTSLTTAK